MKNTILFFALAMLPFITLGQNQRVEKLFEQYSEQEGFTSVYITQHMFDLFADIDTDEEENEFLEITKNLRGIKILHCDSGYGKVNFYNSILKKLPKNEYQELMVIHEKNQDIKFLIKKANKQISEFLMVSGGKDGNTIISIVGDIDLKKISKLSKSMKIGGLEKLEKVDKKSNE